MTIIHGFTSFNTIAPASRIAPSSTVTPGPTTASALPRLIGRAGRPAGTVFRLLSTGQNYRVEDYGWALSDRNTIDLYMANQCEMNSWGAREETIEVLQ
jgi:3D (Asp-Asp-Asp) domain-containing protein